MSAMQGCSQGNFTRQRQRLRQNFRGKGRGKAATAKTEARRDRGKAVWCRGEAEIKEIRAKAPKINHYYHYRFATMQKNQML